MKEIGSIFPLYDRNPNIASEGKDVKIPYNNIADGRLMTSLCREALYIIAEKEKANGTRVMLPQYTCDTVIAPFRQLGYECISYPINKDLTINTVETSVIFSESRPNLIVVHPYFGMELTAEELLLLRKMNKDGCTVIEDLTQCIFSTVRLPFIKYYTGSLRKWFAMADGAFLEETKYSGEDEKACITTSITNKEPINAENKEIVAVQTEAMILRGAYFKTGEERLKTASIRLSHMAEEMMERTIVPHTMATASMEHMTHEDTEKQKVTRIENYKRLYNGLKDVKEIELIADISRLTTAPLFFPFRTKDIKAMQKKLAQKAIYARLIWEPEDRILTIAIDQRYNLEDMDRVIAAIKE